MVPPCLALSNKRYVSRVKWSNPGKEVAPSPTSWCSSYWKGSLLVALDYGRQLSLQKRPIDSPKQHSSDFELRVFPSPRRVNLPSPVCATILLKAMGRRDVIMPFRRALMHIYIYIYIYICRPNVSWILDWRIAGYHILVNAKLFA